MTFLALFLVFFSYLLYFCPLVQSVGREFAGINIKRDKGMKLAEALSIRKDLQKRIQQLGQRIQNNVKVQEGDEPKEQPAELMKELDSCLSQLQELIWRINSTNIETKNGDGKTLTELMAQKDVLTMRISTLRSVFDTASSVGSVAQTRHRDPGIELPNRTKINIGIRIHRANRNPYWYAARSRQHSVRFRNFHGAGSARPHSHAQLMLHVALPPG